MMEQDMAFIRERYELCIERIKEIAKVQEVPEKYQEYFKKEAEFITSTAELAELVESGKYANLPLKELEDWNDRLYAKILPENYETSYANPQYAVSVFGKEIGQFLAAVYAELRSLIAAAYENDVQSIVIRAELFLEIYGMFLDVCEMDTEQQNCKEEIQN